MNNKKNEYFDEKIWSELENKYCGVFRNLGGCHEDNDLLANALIRDRLNRYEDFNLLSEYEVEEIKFFHRMVINIEEDNIRKFRLFSDLHMVKFVDSIKKYINENKCLNKSLWKEFNI